MNPTDHERIRDLLDDAVSDVEPRHGLGEIHARTAPPRVRRPWLWGTGGAVLATAATIAVIAAVSGGPGTTDADPGFAGSAAPTTAASPPADETTAAPAPDVTPEVVAAYFVGDTSHGQRLFREFQRSTSQDPLVDALSSAVSGEAADPDYGSPWPSGTEVRDAGEIEPGANASSGVGFVTLSGPDLADRQSGMTAQQAQLAVDQLVRTFQGTLQSDNTLRFYLSDGDDTAPQRSSTLLGVPTRAPVGPQSDDALAQVQISTPAQGATVDSPFTVEGRAAAFEANVQWELRQGGTVVKRGFTTAEECCTLSPYSFEVTAPPGQYTLVVHDEDASGGEGLPPWQDTKDITVR